MNNINILIIKKSLKLITFIKSTRKAFSRNNKMQKDGLRLLPRHNNNNKPRSRPEFKFYLMMNVQNINNKLVKTYATVFYLHNFFILIKIFLFTKLNRVNPRKSVDFAWLQGYSYI